MAKKAAILAVLLAVILFAVLRKSHPAESTTSTPLTPQEICFNNLRLIQSGKMQWSLEKHANYNQTPTWDDLRPYIGRGSNGIMPECPQHGVYSPGAVAEEPSCSIHGPLPPPR